MTDHRRNFVKELRKLKDDEYNVQAEIIGVTFESNAGEPFIFTEDTELTDVCLNIGVETEHNQRIMTRLEPPTSWDLSSNFVVVFAYLGIEPEEVELLGSASRTLPVTFDHDTNEYSLDFDKMRDTVFRDG
jgi:hypothetical protein